jgi:hypothetical protein
MKLIIFVHTCRIYEDSRAKLIESTWGNHPDVVFITDNEHSALKQHIYIGPYTPGPTYHPNNVTNMFKLFIEKYSSYDFFMMIDDDSYLYIEKLKSYLSFFDKDDRYMIGDFLNWIAPRTEPTFTCDYNRWVSGGPGIVFTKKCVETFLTLIDSFKETTPIINHDVWLHLLFFKSDKRIKRVDCPGFHQYNASLLYKKYPIESNNIISVHLERKMELIKEYHPKAAPSLHP